MQRVAIDRLLGGIERGLRQVCVDAREADAADERLERAAILLIE
jgi:hypothetical protein